MNLARRRLLTLAATVPGDEASTGLTLAPRHTPADTIELLTKEINAGLTGPALKAR